MKKLIVIIMLLSATFMSCEEENAHPLIGEWKANFTEYDFTLVIEGVNNNKLDVGFFKMNIPDKTTKSESNEVIISNFDKAIFKSDEIIIKSLTSNHSLKIKGSLNNNNLKTTLYYGNGEWGYQSNKLIWHK